MIRQTSAPLYHGRQADVSARRDGCCHPGDGDWEGRREERGGVCGAVAAAAAAAER